MFYWQKLAFKNMSRRVKRTLLVGLILFLGSLTITLSIAWGNGMTNQMRQNMILGSLGHIQIFSEKYLQEEAGDMSSSLDRPDLTKKLLIDESDKTIDILKSNQDTDKVNKRLGTKGIASTSYSSQGLMIFGIEPQNEIGMLNTVKSGSTDIGREEIIINEGIANSLRVKKGDTIKVSLTDPTGKFQVLNFKVKDFFANNAPWYSLMAYVNLNYLQEVLGLEENQVSEIIVTLKNQDQVSDFKDSITKDFTSSGVKNRILDWKESGKSLNQVVDGVSMMLYMAYALIFIIVALGIASIVVIIINERLKEMGTMSAIGMTTGQVVRLFVSEMFLLSIISALLGIVTASLIARYLSKVGIQAGANKNLGLIFGGDRLYMKWSYDMVLISFIWIVLVSVISSVFPAIKAALKKPVDALKGNF